MPSAEEQVDIDKLKADTAKVEHDTFMMMRMILEMDSPGLRNCGYKSVEHGLKTSMEMAIRDIKKLTSTFLKKWPDK